MGIQIEAGVDVVSFLMAQHEEIKEVFERVLATRGAEREKAFIALRRLLAVHETAEEEIVHPMARKVLPDGERIVDARLAEEKAAKRALAELEAMMVDSPQFETAIRALQTKVVAHAESEEREEFGAMAASVDPPRLDRMRKAAELAEKVAPTHPHAGVESAGANLLAGPFDAMMDRARDALASKHSPKN
jgi:hypothetical protein